VRPGLTANYVGEEKLSAAPEAVHNLIMHAHYSAIGSFMQIIRTLVPPFSLFRPSLIEEPKDPCQPQASNY
jgi:hypothetical protein